MRHVADFAPDQLVAIRKERGWTATKLAHQSGVSVAAIQSWERGATRPTIVSLSQVAEALGVPVWRLIDAATWTDEAAGLQTLRALRVWAGLTIADVAQEAAYSASSVSRVESGIGALTDGLAHALASVYQVEVGLVRDAYRVTVSSVR
jgi:transcriptional regulator with XRE-family HTH domain